MNRLEAVRREMAEQGVTTLLVSNIANCRYLSGFTGADVFLVVASGFKGIAVDPRYVVQAQSECPDWHLIGIRGDVAAWFPTIAGQYGASVCGIESDSMSVLSYQRLVEALTRDNCEIKIKPVHGLVQKLRVMKQPEELAAIEAACLMVDQALKEVVSLIKAGMTEKQVAWLVESNIRHRGSGSVPFEVIVASGPNAAMPHASPTDRIIRDHEPVLIDCGAKVDGYCSDITRTYCLGEPDEKFKNVYTSVLGAQQAVLSALLPGMTGGEADQLARSILQECGLEEYFQHGLGHGAGLEIHELPRVGSKSEDKLVETMVFTIEPGVYVPGWGGIRIEDTVVMEAGGIRALTKASKEPLLAP